MVAEGEDILPTTTNLHRRHMSSSSMKRNHHKTAKPTLSLRSTRGSFKLAGISRRSASPGSRELVPLTTLSSKDEDSIPLDNSSSSSNDNVYEK